MLDAVAKVRLAAYGTVPHKILGVGVTRGLAKPTATFAEHRD